MQNLEAVIEEARQQFLIASANNFRAEGVAIQTREGFTFGGRSSDEALRPLTDHSSGEIPEDLTPKFEVASIAIAVANGASPNKKTLDNLAAYPGTQDGHLVTIVSVDNAGQIAKTISLKL